MSSNLEMRTLLDTVQTLEVLQKHFAQVAPPYFAQSCQILGLRNGTLSIAAANGTLAAKLRQLAPEMATKLQNRGCEVNGIRVKVQVTYAPVVAQPAPRHLTNKACNALSELSASLDDSPLKTALEKFAQKNL